MRQFFIVIFIFLAVCAGSVPGSAGNLPVTNSESSFEFGFSLPLPVAASDQGYLGLTGKDRFTLGQIKGRIVLVEIFSMYCPICQREAKNVNKLFDLIQSDEGLKYSIKMIGIGAGNSEFEAEFFRSNYTIPFPLFSDAAYEIHKGVGQVGTPHFFGLKILEGGQVKLFFSHSGEMESPTKLLQQLKEQSGLEFE